MSKATAKETATPPGDPLADKEHDQTRRKAGKTGHAPLFGRHFSEREQKQLFLYLVIGIVLAELAITVSAVIYSITNARIGMEGLPQFRFPWLGYVVALLVAPAVILLLVHLVNLVFSRPSEGTHDMEGVPGRIRTFYALVRGAPTVILLGAVVLAGVGVYYLDGVMALLLKIGDSFQTIAIWLIGGFTAAWIVSYAVRAAMHYKTRQMEAEYAFRREVLERTGMVLLDTKHAPVTELRLLPGSSPALPEGEPLPPPSPQTEASTGQPGALATPAEVIEACARPVEKGAGATPDHASPSRADSSAASPAESPRADVSTQERQARQNMA